MIAVADCWAPIGQRASATLSSVPGVAPSSRGRGTLAHTRGRQGTVGWGDTEPSSGPPFSPVPSSLLPFHRVADRKSFLNFPLACRASPARQTRWLFASGCPKRWSQPYQPLGPAKLHPTVYKFFSGQAPAGDGIAQLEQKPHLDAPGMPSLGGPRLSAQRRVGD